MDKLAFLKRAKGADILAQAVEASAKRDAEIAEKLGHNPPKNATDELEDLRRIREEVKTAIGTIEDTTIRGIMTFRFLDYLTEEEIAERVHYSVRTVRRKIKQGLEKMSLNVL